MTAYTSAVRFVLALIALFGCAGSGGSTPPGPVHNSLIRQSDEPPGANCVTGGVAIASGLDDNDDGVLDDIEVSQTSYVCHGAAGAQGPAGPAGVDGAAGPAGTAGPAGASALLRITPLAPGASCAAGGATVAAGVDADGDGVLADAEVTDSEYLCHGIDGAPGAAGAPGADGADGADGANAAVRLDDLVADAACPFGGTTVLVGLDSDGDGLLGDAEVVDTADICHASVESGCRPGFDFQFGWCMETALRTNVGDNGAALTACADDGMVLCPFMLPHVGRYAADQTGIATTLGGRYAGITKWLDAGISGFNGSGADGITIGTFDGVSGGASLSTNTDGLGGEFACCYPAPPPAP